MRKQMLRLITGSSAPRRAPSHKVFEAVAVPRLAPDRSTEAMSMPFRDSKANAETVSMILTCHMICSELLFSEPLSTLDPVECSDYPLVAFIAGGRGGILAPDSTSWSLPGGASIYHLSFIVGGGIARMVFGPLYM